MRAVGADLFVASIVEEDDIAAANLPGDLAFDYGGRRGVPVIAGDVPHDRFEVEFAGYAENGGAASAEGRTEEIGMLADGILECGFTLGEFLPDFRFGFEYEKRMGEGVIADDVAGLDNFSGDLRMLTHVAADEKKSRMDAVQGKDFKKALGMGVVGSVVVGEGDLASAARRAAESFSVPLPGRRHGLVTRRDRRGESGAGDDVAEHGSIVMGDC